MADPFDPAKLPVPLEPRPEADGKSSAHSSVKGARADPAFAAHTLGQGGQKRGLKGGEPVLQAARKSYLQAQWSGPGDRRMPAGVIRRDEV